MKSCFSNVTAHAIAGLGDAQVQNRATARGTRESSCGGGGGDLPTFLDLFRNAENLIVRVVLIVRAALNLVRQASRHEHILYSHHGHKCILLSATLRRRYTYLERYWNFHFLEYSRTPLEYKRSLKGEERAERSISNSETSGLLDSTRFFPSLLPKKRPDLISIRETPSVKGFEKS